MTFSLEPLLSSFILLFLAEIGDKTQLLLLGLATRFRSGWGVFFGALAAEAVMDGLAIYVGDKLGAWVPLALVKQVGGLAFIGLGLWVLGNYRKEEAESRVFSSRNAFFAAFGTILLSEFGDKSQITAGLLALQWHHPFEVFLGVLFGLGLASAISIFLGRKLAERLPKPLISRVSGALFVLFGLFFVFT